MLTYLRRSIGLGALAAACVLALGAYAFASSGALQAPMSGTGSGSISGYAVSGVAYTTSADLLTGVSFDLDAVAAQVDVRLDSTGGRWFACGGSAVTSPFSVSCMVSVPVAAADTLTVRVRQ